MKLAVVGSRGFSDFELLNKEISKYSPKIIISGGANGTDTLARTWALKNKITLIEYLPDWSGEGKKAGMLRNIKILSHCDKCLAFWDGESKGTKFDIDYCKLHNIPCEVIKYNDKQLKLQFN